MNQRNRAFAHERERHHDPLTGHDERPARSRRRSHSGGKRKSWKMQKWRLRHRDADDLVAALQDADYL